MLRLPLVVVTFRLVAPNGFEPYPPPPGAGESLGVDAPDGEPAGANNSLSNSARNNSRSLGPPVIFSGWIRPVTPVRNLEGYVDNSAWVVGFELD